MTVNIILRSKFWGAGKTYAALSFKSPDKDPVRLVFDGEYRDETFKSPDKLDHIELAQFSFDFWHKVYGDIPESLIAVATQIRTGKFPYNMIAIDNASIFQDDLDKAMRNQANAMALAKATGCYERHENFLGNRFRPTDVAAYYHLVKGIIQSFLRDCRKNSIDVIVTSESRNVWENYGSRDRAKPPTILGQTAKLWDPWFQMADAVFVLERMEGDRAKGEAKLTPWPNVSLDTFNTKISIPGVLPQFTFKDWNVFWNMAKRRRLPTVEEYAAIQVESGVASETVMETNAEAKRAVMDHALKVGFVTSETKEDKQKLLDMALASGLDPENVLAQYFDWIGAIDTAMEDDHGEE